MQNKEAKKTSPSFAHACTNLVVASGFQKVTKSRQDKSNKKLIHACGGCFSLNIATYRVRQFICRGRQ